MKRRDVKSQRTQRLLASASGILVAILAGIPLAMTLIMFFSVYNPNDGLRMLALPLISIIGFGSIFSLGIRSAIKRWREVAKVQQIINGMDSAERKEFYDVVENGDVELVEGDDGKVHSAPLDH